VRGADRDKFALKNFTDKFIRHKKENKTGVCFEKLLHYAAAFSYEHTVSFTQIKRALGGVPDLTTFHYIDKVVILAPGIFELVLERAIKKRYQRLTTAQLPVISWIGFYFIVDIKHYRGL
jgi:hypothetical protein